MSLSRFLQRGRRTRQQQASDGNDDSLGREIGRGIADGAVAALTIAKNSTDWVPVVKGVLGGVAEIIDLCRQFKNNKEAWKEFSEYLEHLRTSIEEKLPAEDQTPTNDVIRDMRQFASVLDSIGMEVIKMKNRPGILKRFQTREDPSVISGFRRRIDEQSRWFLVIGMFTLRMSNPTQVSNLPVHSTTLDFSTTVRPVPAHFYGRDQYIQDAIDKLFERLTSKQPTNLAVMGPGGMGKTSVASAILHHSSIKEYFGSHIFFVSCEAIITGGALAATIMKSFGLPLGEGDVAKNFLTAMSNYKFPAILCLDNFETPWDFEDDQAISMLLEHLTSLQMITVLLTMHGTEIPIKHRAHWIQIPVLGRLSEDDAVKAFSAIAELVLPEDNEQISELMRCVDCMPLAITLLARRHCVSREPIHQLIKLWREQRIISKATRKDDNMDISIKLSLDAKKMVDCPNALRLLTIMSHLPDGVAQDDLPMMVSMNENEINEAIFTLQSMSLAFVSNSGWLGTLSPIRLYVLHHEQMLQEDVLSLQQFVFNLTDAWRAAVGTPGYVDTKQHLDSAWGNVTSLLIEWLQHDPAHEDVLKSMCGATYAMGFYIPDGLLMQQALKCVTAGTLAHAECLQSMGDILGMQYKYSEAQEKLEDAMAEFRKIGSNLGAAWCLQRLGNILKMQNKYSEAQKKLEDAMAEFRKIGSNQGAAQCLQSLGDNLRMQDKYPEAQEKLENAMAEFKKIGDNLGADQCLQSLGDILRMQDKYPEAQEKLENAMAEFKKIGDNLGAAQCLQSLGDILRMQYKYSEAQEKLEDAMAEFRRIGDNLGEAQCLKSLGDILQMQYKYPEAQEKLEDAMAEFRKTGSNQGAAQCLQRLGNILRMQYKCPEAQEKLEDAMAEFRKTGSDLGAAQCLRSLGEILQMQYKYPEAQEKLEDAMAEFRKIGSNLGAAQCMQSLGDILRMQDKYPEAQEKLENAMAEFRKIGDNLGGAQCLKSLALVHIDLAEYADAKIKLKESQGFFDCIGDEVEVRWCQARLAGIQENIDSDAN